MADMSLFSVTVHTHLVYQYYRHFIFSLAQAPWNDSTYSFELSLNVWLSYSTRSRHRTSVSGDGSTATADVRHADMSFRFWSQESGLY